jgi:bacitracin synthase 3
MMDFERARQYWMDRLADLPLDMELTQKRDRQNGAGQMPVPFDEELGRKLTALSNNQDVLLLVVLVAILKIVLRKYSRRDDSVLWVPIYSTVDIDDAANRWLPLRDRLDPSLTFKQWLVEVKGTVIGGYKHQHYSINNVLTALGFPPEAPPMRQVKARLGNIHDASTADFTVDSGFYLGFDFSRREDQMTGSIVYNRRYFDPFAVQGLGGHFIEAARQVTEDMNRVLGSITLISPQAKQDFLENCNTESVAPATNDTVWDMFQRNVHQTPDRIVCVAAGESLTYRQLSHRCIQLAHRLNRELGVLPSDRIAVLCERSLDLATALLGVMGAGSCYVPLDPSFPQNRIRAVLDDAAVKGVVTMKKTEHLIGDGYPQLVLDSGEADENLPEGDEDTAKPPAAPQPVDPVYAIYTSGSTGRPKGVLIRHANLASFAAWRARALSYTAEDVSLQLLSPAFDAFGSNLYPVLCSGGAMVMVKEERLADYDVIRRLIDDYRVTNLSVLPSMYRLLLDGAKDGDLRTLRFVVLGGDAADVETVRTSRRRFPHIALVNEYGPTETCVAISANLHMKEDTIFNIGSPVDGNHVYILDVDDCPLPAGVPGELCVEGPNVGAGYLNDVELTNSKFVPIYRSGDRARVLEDGSLEYLGRIDRQVKIRGYRVEPAEVEVLLRESQLLDDAVVATRQDTAGDSYLCAYWIPGSKKTDETQLKDYLAEVCPPYMIPAYFVALDSFPLTANGKVNRDALPRPEALKTVDYVAPRDEQERQLAGIWSELLGIPAEKIGVFDNFFDLGGHSLKVTMLISKILKIFDVKISLADIFRTPQIAAMSQLIGRSAKTGTPDIRPVEKRDYYPLSSAQTRLYFLNQFSQIGTSYNMPFAVRVSGQLDVEKAEAAFTALAARHEALRTAFLTVDSQPVQRIVAPAPFTVSRFDLSNAGGDRDQNVRRVIDDFVAPFPLDRPPLMRVALIQVAEQEAILLFDIHHIICDGTSGGILGSDFLRLYAGETLQPLRVQYKDYACWQRSMADEGEIDRQERYWLEVYAPDRPIPALQLPLDFPRGETMTYGGDRFQFELEPDLFSDFQELGRRYNATLYMNLLAVFNVLLHKYTADCDIIVGCAVAGRNHEDLRHILGMFINILPMRNFPAGDKSYAAFLSEVGERVVRAFDHQDYPFERLIGHLKPRLANDPARHPLYVVDFTLQNFAQAEERPLDVKVTPYKMENKTSKLDMNLMAYERKDRIRFSLEYCSGLFKPETIEKMAGHLLKIIETVSGDPDILIKDIQLLEAGEQESVVRGLQKSKSLVAQLAGEDFDELF